MTEKHNHTISDFSSGYTDTTNGHRHKLIPENCELCAKQRLKLFGMGCGFTEPSPDGHRHYFIGQIYK